MSFLPLRDLARARSPETGERRELLVESTTSCPAWPHCAWRIVSVSPIVRCNTCRCRRAR